MLIRAIILACLVALPAGAQTVRQEFDLRFRGLTVARLILADNTALHADGLYAIAARAESTGLAALLRDFRFDLQATGMINGLRFAPRSYAETINTGRRASSAQIRWQSGIPIIDARSPDRTAEPWDIDPAAQTGTIDPLSAVYTLAQSRAAVDLCDLSLDVFDGRRRSTLSLGPATPQGDTITCTGAYQRIAGFSPEEMAEMSTFPITITYTAQSALWHLTEVRLQTLYGPMRIIQAAP